MVARCNFALPSTSATLSMTKLAFMATESMWPPGSRPRQNLPAFASLGQPTSRFATKLALEACDLGLQSLKNVAEPVRIYRIMTGPSVTNNLLHGDRAFNRIHHAAKFGQHAITSGVDHATAVCGDHGEHDGQVILQVANGASSAPSARCSQQYRPRELPPTDAGPSDFRWAPTSLARHSTRYRLVYLAQVQSPYV